MRGGCLGGVRLGTRCGCAGHGSAADGRPQMSAESAGTIALPSGEEIAAAGQGTWYLGEDPGRREQEIAAAPAPFTTIFTLSSFFF